MSGGIVILLVLIVLVVASALFIFGGGLGAVLTNSEEKARAESHERPRPVTRVANPDDDPTAGFGVGGEHHTPQKPRVD